MVSIKIIAHLGGSMDKPCAAPAAGRQIASRVTGVRTAARGLRQGLSAPWATSLLPKNSQQINELPMVFHDGVAIVLFFLKTRSKRQEIAITH
ncbi:MAG: hypothetical protein LBP52_03850 [Burkholderiaceae bacterium]|nr:hypothetical protein [Burkholderiaceae bacterium]